mgnify:FL=1
MKMKACFCCLFLTVVSLLLISDKPVAAEDSWSTKIRVLLLNVDPLMPSEGGCRLTEFYRWNDPEKLALEFIADVASATHGQVICEVVETIRDDQWPPFLDGVAPYTDVTFRHDWEGPRRFIGRCDYAAILNRHKVREKVESGQIDEVWMFGFPGMGCYETRMAGKGAIWCNGPVIDDFACERPFVVYGFNYERGVDCMLEDLGHRAESIMAHVFRDAPADHTWARFTRHEKTHPGEAACGNVHFAPNSESDYDWGNTRPVYSTCDDWAVNFPALTGEKRLVTATEWGNGDMRLHHIWWMRRFPHHAGDFEGYYANWWKYIFAWEKFHN